MPLNKCPVCGQDLLDREAQARVQKNLDKLLEREKTRLEREAKRQAKVIAKQEVEELRRQHQVELERESTRAAAEERRTHQKEQARLKRKIDELQRRLENQTADQRGELSEADLLAQLKAAFPNDEIQRLTKRQAGADILHEIREHGTTLGLIAYECKDAAAWKSAFISQACKARSVHKTRHVVLVSNVFPKGHDHLCVVRDVPVVHPAIAIYLARYLREAIVAMAQTDATDPDRQRIADRLLQYLQSEEFKQKISAIGNALQDLRALQGKERQDHERTWSRQSEHIAAIERNTTSLEGRITAIVHGGPTLVRTDKPSLPEQSVTSRRKAVGE